MQENGQLIEATKDERKKKLVKNKELKVRDSRTRISAGKRCKVKHVDQRGMGRDRDDNKTVSGQRPKK